MKSALWTLQVSIFSCLKNDTALQVKAKVYDSVPEGTAFPYVTIGEDTVIPDNDKLQHGEEITHTLHIWSDYNGKKEVKEIMSLVLEATTREPLLLDSGFSMDFTSLDMMQVLETNGTPIKHGVIRLRFKVKQTSTLNLIK